MKVRFKVLILSLFVLLIASPALAAEKESSSSLILSGGRSVARNACESPWVAVGGGECSETNKIFRIAYNYKFSPAWGFEISGGDLGDARSEGTYLGNPYSWQMKADGWTLAGIGYLNMGSNFSLFGKLGIVRTHLIEHIGTTVGGVAKYGASLNGVPTTLEEKYAPTYGVGFQFNFAKNIGMRFQYESFGQYDIYSAYGVSTPEKISLTAVSAGLMISY